ncbi:hypothetical protein ACXM1Q_002340 [Streptococcus sp. 10F2]
MRLWLEHYLLKVEVGQGVDCCKVDKEDYLLAMEHRSIRDAETMYESYSLYKKEVL